MRRSDSTRRRQLEDVRAAVAASREQVARGEVYEWTPETMAEIQREADEADRLGLPISDDVMPQSANLATDRALDDQS
jgi:hypothetical protein